MIMLPDICFHQSHFHPLDGWDTIFLTQEMRGDFFLDVQELFEKRSIHFGIMLITLQNKTPFDDFYYNTTK